MTQMKAHLKGKTSQLIVPRYQSLFRWLNKETLWPLRYLETFFSQITKLASVSDILTLSYLGKGGGEPAPQGYFRLLLLNA